jgi:hypothetical protein|nr:MAG TPA: hypothetical protein [Caudoviricetes sp.]
MREDLEIKEADYTSRFSILMCILTSGYAEFYVNHGSRLRYQDGTALKFFAAIIVLFLVAVFIRSTLYKNEKAQAMTGGFIRSLVVAFWLGAYLMWRGVYWTICNWVEGAFTS